MAVAGTADYDVTRNELIDLSLSLLGVSEVAQEDRTLAVRVLNSLVRHLDSRGTWLWTIDNTESTLTTVSGQQEYTPGSGSTEIALNILKLEYAAVLKGDDREVLTILDKPSSLRTVLQDESDNQPEQVHLAKTKLLNAQAMLFYPTPNAAYSIVYKYRRPLFDFDTATDNPDFPSAFILPLQKLLAVELQPHYGAPLQERQLMKAEGEAQFREAASDHADRPAYEPVKTEYF